VNVRDRLPSTPRLRGRDGVGAGQPVDGTFGGIFFSIIEVLAVVPESRFQGRAVNRHSAGPGCAAAAAIGHKVEDGRAKLGISAGLFEAFLPGPSTVC